MGSNASKRLGSSPKKNAQEALALYLRSAHRVEQSSVRVPQPVPAHSRQSDLLTGRLELSIDEIAPIERCPLIG